MFRFYKNNEYMDSNKWIITTTIMNNNKWNNRDYGCQQCDNGGGFYTRYYWVTVDSRNLYILIYVINRPPGNGFL
jgi:hypothetical protein